MNLGKVSIVIPSHNEGDNLVDTVRCILKNTDYSDFEVVVVDDGSTDKSGQRTARLNKHDDRITVVRTQGLGVAGARNIGSQQSSGDILVFLDGHSYVPRHWLPVLIAPLADPKVGMVGPAFASLKQDNGARGFGIIWQDASLEMEWLPQTGDEPYAVPLLPGGCQVMRKADFKQVGCYDGGMTRWGCEDQELSFRTYLMGFRIVVQPQVVIYHLFRESHPYHVDMKKIIYNRLRMATFHLSEDRLARVIDRYKDTLGFSEILVWLLESDVNDRRRQWLQQRRRDDTMFCDQFNCRI